MDLNNKFGVLSIVLPPSQSGQAIVIYRLLEGLPSENYCLITHNTYKQNYTDVYQTKKLPGKYLYFKKGILLKLNKVFKYLIPFFKINVLFEIYWRAIKINSIIRREKLKKFIACTNDLYDLPASLLACKWSKINCIAYIFDDFAYQWSNRNHSIAKWLEPSVIRNADNVIVTNEFMAEEYIRRYGIRSTVIRNPYQVQIEKKKNNKEFFNKEDFNIVYAGAIYDVHYDVFRNLIKAINKIEDRNVILHIYTGEDKDSLTKQGISGKKVLYQGHVDHLEILKIFQNADLLFLPLAFNTKLTEVVKTSSPGKLGDYLSIGKPILVHAPKDSFICWYFKKNNCGLVVDKNDVNILHRCLRDIISDKNLQIKLGNEARKRAEIDFSLAISRNNFFKIINDENN